MPSARAALQWAALFAVVALVVAGCAPPQRSAEPPRQEPAGATANPQPAAPRGTLKIAWGPEPASLSPKLGAVGFTAFSELAMTFNSALAYVDPQGQPHPQLANVLPERALKLAFAALMLLVAGQFLLRWRRTVKEPPAPGAATGPGPSTASADPERSAE